MEPHAGDHPPGGVREELRALGGRTATRSASTPTRTRPRSARRCEALFDVHVVEVRTMSVKPKPKRRGITRGRTRAWKKAIVQVREGENIPIFQGLAALD